MTCKFSHVVPPARLISNSAVLIVRRVCVFVCTGAMWARIQCVCPASELTTRKTNSQGLVCYSSVVTKPNILVYSKGCFVWLGLSYVRDFWKTRAHCEYVSHGTCNKPREKTIESPLCNPLSSVFEAVLPANVFGPFPTVGSPLPIIILDGSKGIFHVYISAREIRRSLKVPLYRLDNWLILNRTLTIGRNLYSCERRRRLITKIHANLVFSGVYLAFLEVFQDKEEFVEMLAVSYFVLQACITVLRCFRQEWRTSVSTFFA